MKLTCASCGDNFDASRKTARFCSERCRTRGHRGHLAPVDGGKASDSNDVAPPIGVASSTRAVLEAAGRLDTPLAQTALRLAARIDAGQDTGAGLAALARQHEASLTSALANLERAGDPVDRLRLVVGERRGG